MTKAHFCVKCGTALTHTFQFCPQCGAKTDVIQTKSKSVFFIILFLIILVALVLAVISFVPKTSNALLSRIATFKKPETIVPAVNLPSASLTGGNQKNIPIQIKTISLSGLIEDKDNGYTIQYPTDWQYENSDKQTLIIRGKTGTPEYNTIIAIQTTPAKKAGGTYSNPQELMKSLREQFAAHYTDIKIEKSGALDIMVGGTVYTSENLTFSYKFNNQDFRKMVFIIPRADGQILYTYSYTAPAKDYQTNILYGQSMLHAWTIQNTK